MTPRTRALLAGGGAAIVLVSILLEIVVPADHGPGWREYWFHHVPALHAAIGLAGCWLIVKVSKLFGKVFVQRAESYYGEADPDVE
jgi:hypothetical protein